MRTRLIIVALLLGQMLWAQQTVPIRGRIVDQGGRPVEYVQIGIPKYGIGTISTKDGRFEISVPRDTLEFHHVSYETFRHPVEKEEDDLVITLTEAELPPSVAIGGNSREKYLIRPGTKIVEGLIDFYAPSGHILGRELGSVAKVGKDFLVEEISFSIRSNFIPGCVAAINIYRIEEGNFSNILHSPIYVDVAVSGDTQYFDIHPEESIMLTRGNYFVAFQIVSYDEDALSTHLSKDSTERNREEMHLYAVLYFKSSFIRDVALGEFSHFPVNIGIAVKGREFN